MEGGNERQIAHCHPNPKNKKAFAALKKEL